MNRSRSKPFGPEGCQVPIGEGFCGETSTLDIINKFKRLYENKLREIDSAGGGDCLQEKIKLQQDWIGDLTEQNEMLVRAVEELEHEATERVNMLEEKLQQSAKCICEVMNRYREYDVTSDLLKDPQKRIFYLENDLKNLLEFIRRIRDENQWSIGGLKFYEIAHEDLIGDKNKDYCRKEQINESRYLIDDITKVEGKVKDRDSTIQELHGKISEIDHLTRELNSKNEECNTLQQEMVDMRQALTEEVASKHDVILKLKRDLQELEERCIQADKQTAFRDDIIKELRKEIKHLKQQVIHPEKLLKNQPADIHRKNANGEQILVINHTRKIVQSGKSTLIYLRHDSNDMMKDKKFNIDEQASNCSKISKNESDVKKSSRKIALMNNSNGMDEIEKSLHLCKSENDLFDFKKMLKPVKDRSKLTNSTMNRCNTFVDSTTETSKKLNFDPRLKQESLKYNVEASVENLQNNLEKYFEGRSDVDETKHLLKDLISIADTYTKGNLYSFMENEIIQLNRIIEIKQKQLKELLDLIKVLVQRLYVVDKGLKFLEERAQSVVSLEKAKHILEINVKEEKKQILDLEKQFKEFLQDRLQLKGKCKSYERQSKCIQEENEKLKLEKDSFRDESEKLKQKIFEYSSDKKMLEVEMKEALNSFIIAEENCVKKVELLTIENKKLINELCHMNGENRDLLNSVEDYKKRIGLMTTVMKDEIVKLTTTIDELQITLQQTKQLQEEEEKRYLENVSTLNNTIEEERNNLKEAQEKSKICKICSKRSRVGFADNTEVQTDTIVEDKSERDYSLNLMHRDNIIKSQNETLNMMQEEMQSLKKNEFELRSERNELRNKINELEKTDTKSNQDLEKVMAQVQNKEEIIKNQKETLNIMQSELESLREAELGLKSEREKYCQSIEHLKNKINELEVTLQNADGRADNLQMAVDLYMNSINVLEASEQKYKIEIDQQRVTISNLQRALVDTKQELDSIKLKSEENELDQHKLMSELISFMTGIEDEKDSIKRQFDLSIGEYERLQELNLLVEIEHCNSLQDVDGLDNHLLKYQHLLKYAEEENRQYKSNLKRMRKQKKCYEEVIIYFKHEMGLMSEQLQNLQDLLSLSNESANEESSKLMHAFMNVQAVNQQLSFQLTAAEQTVLLENQMNQLHEAKISELERLVSEKEIDLGRHDQAINNIRQSVKGSLKQNEELHATIVSLNETILKLQQAIKKYETDNGKSREVTQHCQAQINMCKNKLTELKGSLEKKTAELCKLEMAYNEQNRSLQYAQRELNEMKEKQKDKQCNLKCIIALKTKLEENSKNAKDEIQQLKTELGVLTKKDGVKDGEIKRYRKIIGDLKKTLIELNKNLSKKSLQFESKCNTEECKKFMEQTEDETEQNIFPNCPCAGEFYQSIVESLKKSVIELKRKLNETQKRNQDLEEDRKKAESQLVQISKSQQDRDREYNDLKRKLIEKLKQAEVEQTRYSEQTNQFEREMGSLKQELEHKTLQLDEREKSLQEISGSRCVQLACAQEEVSTLKEDLNNLLRKHCAVNVENERLHFQSARMQSTVSNLEETSQLLKGQVEQYLTELQKVQTEKDALMQKNHDLLSELRSLQSSYNSANKQQRYNQESIKMLESELNEVKNSREEICFESKNAIDYFRSWLQEQKKINLYVMSKERDYLNTIDMLKQETEGLRFQRFPEVQCPCPKNTCCKTATPPPTCQSPWSLGSQGTASVHDDSPSRSPCPQECDWYSSSFRNESEDEEDIEDDWVTKVEDLAAQVRQTNKMWRNKMGNSEYTVSKDTKK
ncbi:hypothetical protein JTB14_017804 [Gonioctena quinquepunctata]|nr:hypothetical protein JTB14_017804 [Gonioctena quinquepunctata]